MVLEGNKSTVPYVLIVDDIKINICILANMMEQMGYVALPAKSAREALEIIKQILPQLILLDVSMPQMDGFELCSILKQNPVTREIPVIFISAMDEIKDKLKGLELGAADFITKPFEITEVTIRVRNQMENYRMKQELKDFNHKLHKMLSEQAQKIESEQKNLLCVMAKLAEASHGASVNYLDYVGYNSRLLAQSLQLVSPEVEEITEDFIETIENAAKLHNLGRIFEMEITNSSQNNSEYILKELWQMRQQSSFLGMVIDIIWFRDDRWDGQGNENGIKEDGIPLAARIVAVARAFSGWAAELKSQNFSAERLSDEEVVRESLERLLAGSGTFFQPKLVEIMFKIKRRLQL